MPSTSSKVSFSAKKTETDSEIITALTDLSKCDDRLTRRLARALNITVKPSAAVKGKQRSVESGTDVEYRKRLAMRAANAASQNIAKVLQSGWKALTQNSKVSIRMESILCVVSSFRMCIRFLRDADAGFIEAERVSSGFVGKLVAVQLYEPALELLDEIRRNILRQYNDVSPAPSPKAVHSTSKSLFMKYMHLLQYPRPAPQDPVLLALIGTSLCQALTSVTAMLPPPPVNNTILEMFIETIQGDDGPFTWHSSLPTDHADTLLARIHGLIATSFSSTNTSSKLLLKLRSLALRCLLYRVSLDPSLFWAQATDYMASHGKSVTKSDEAANVIHEVMELFNGVIAIAGGRHDAASFLSGPAFLKFCEVALIFAKRGNITDLNNVTRFISDNCSADGILSHPQDDVSDVTLNAVLSHGVAALEKCAANESDVIKSLSRCTEVLSRNCKTLNSRSKAGHSLEHLRRACGKLHENLSYGSGLREVVKSVILKIIEKMEHCNQGKGCGDFTPNIVDALCQLAKGELSPTHAGTHTTSYEFLQRAKTLIDSHNLEELLGKGDVDTVLSLAKFTRVLAGAFWNSAVALYQDSKYAPAIRFLMPACGLTAKVCNSMNYASLTGSVDLMNESWEALKSHLPNRWELLADCYMKIGERRPAYDAFLEALKSHSFQNLCRSASSLLPDQLSQDAAHRRLAMLVERMSHVAVFDLFMRGEASLRQTLCATGVNRETVGIILEWQATSLVGSLWKKEVRPALDRILRDLLDLYTTEFPLRRVRVRLRQLDLAYRTDDPSVPVDQIIAEINDLLESEKDAAFVDMQHQYRAAMHIWMVFHSHQRSQNNSQSAIIHHATQASKILNNLFPPTQVAKSTKLPSKTTVSTKTMKSSTRTSRKTRDVDVNPVTPKPQKLVTWTSPNSGKRKTRSPTALPKKPARAFTDNDFVVSIQMIAQLMGILGHVILKIQFLNVLQRLAELNAGTSVDDFVRTSVDAANEYLRLGKTRRAMGIYAQAFATFESATVAIVSHEVRVMLLLHYASCHALNGDVEKSLSLYQQACDLSQGIECHQDNSSIAKIRARVISLERTALASNVFAVIQVAQDDPYAAFSTLKKSLRLWNRAVDTLSRLSPSPPPATPNPFEMTTVRDALPHTSGFRTEESQPKRRYPSGAIMGGLQWRIAEGLLHTLFALGQGYFLQGTVRGAEFYMEQARDLAESLHSPALLSRALVKKGELQLYQGNLEATASTLLQVSRDLPGIDTANVNRIRALYSQLTDKQKEANVLYSEIVDILSALENTLEVSIPGSRRSFTPQSPGNTRHADVLVPGFLAAVLKQQIWLQRHEPQTKTKVLLDQISALPPSRETKAEELAILAKLAMHEAHVQSRTDLFLSSLTETTIALPIGVPNHGVKLSSSTKQMLERLNTAKETFWAYLELVANRGQATDIREVVMSLALIGTFQTSLGKTWPSCSSVIAGLLDASAAITLRREFIDEIDHKFINQVVDDFTWPSNNGRLFPGASLFVQRFESGEDLEETHGVNLKAYWHGVRDRYYNSYNIDEQSVCRLPIDILPAHWIVVSINITEDKSTMFFSRQRCNREPLIFCVPLERHGRKEEDRSEQFTYHDAVGQLRDILRESDASAEEAKNVPPQDREAKVAWWAKRAALDKRMRELLENIEFCWLGAFKTILSEPSEMQPEAIKTFRLRLENVFKRNLASDKKRMSRVRLDDTLMECFASLSPKCADEELEDLIYFVLDLYQFHGVHIALSEVDMEQLTVELRTELEEHALKFRGRVAAMDDAHLFLVLDKNVQGIPWESLPILRGRSVSRIPSLSFLIDRMELAKLQRESVGLPPSPISRAMVNPKRTYYVLNPSGDLTKSQARFGAWLKEMERTVGWQGIVGRVPSEQELLNALSKKDLFIYFGHGGAEQYVRSYKIKQLQQCAAAMLWGCSSGLMREMGDFDRIGTPYNYILAGCPTLVACLWDVTDNELDKISRSVFDKLQMDPEHVQAWCSDSMDEAPKSVVAAVAQSRDACKLKYLTGAAPVVYGIPFYL